MNLKSFVKSAVKAVMPYGILVLCREIRANPQIFKFWAEVYTQKKEFENRISIATMLRDEAPYLKEWIEYHKLIGVEKFYIFDNYSTDNIKEIVQPYIEAREVEYTLFPDIEIHSLQTQVEALNEAIEKTRGKTEWLCIIDVDEYIVPVKYDSISDMLDNLGKRIAAVELVWVMYGYNSHYKKPSGLVLENYRKSWDKKPIDSLPHLKEEYVKSIVKPHFVKTYSVHSGWYVLFSKRIRKRTDEIRINHYWTKSYEELIDKFTKNYRGFADNNKGYKNLPAYDPNFLSNREDYVVEKYISKLKEKMAAAPPHGLEQL
jgi:hypothetical protein